jgi:TonB family protein
MNMRTSKYILISVTVVLLGWSAFAQTNSSSQPAVVSAVAPLYPPIIRTAGLSGDYYVDVEINRSGKVISAKALRAPKLMQKVIEEAAGQWQFAPDPNGQKNRKVQLTFSFRRMPLKTSNFEGTPVFYPPYRIEVRDSTEIINNPSY